MASTSNVICIRPRGDRNMSFRLVAFGEAMIRYAPAPDAPPPVGGAEAFVRSVGGDELNVCVDLAMLNKGSACPAPQWVSVLPEGPMGDVVALSGSSAGVDMRHVLRVPHSEVGTFTVIPELKTVHYQRRNSAFAKHSPSAFDWRSILAPKEGGPPAWLHMTGITPMINEAPRLSWCLAMEAAHALGVPVSMDFNLRKQLGTLGELWAVTVPQLSRLELLILSKENLVELSEMHKLGDAVPGPDVPPSDSAWRRALQRLRQAIGVKRLAVCFKTRDAMGLQRRWSAVADAAGVHTTVQTPVFHRPRDECGGGSAWAAGIIDSIAASVLGGGGGGGGADAAADPFADVIDSTLARAARHADLSAAMCQETVGDHSDVTRAQLDSVEAPHAGKPVDLPAAMASLRGGGVAGDTTDVTLKTLKTCGVLAILRAKNADAAIARGIELVELGCRAIEVTLDTAEWRRVLRSLVEKLPDSVCVGVGTVMDDTVCCLEEIAAIGGKFALSPINPTGFMEECRRVGLLAVPSGLSSNELWELHRRGAKMIKLFHAGQVTAKILKSMLGVSPLAAMNIMPSGGVSPGNVDEWLDAGAAIVGMGSNLAGSDINHTTGSEGYNKARAAWDATGRDAARAVFDAVAKRYK